MADYDFPADLVGRKEYELLSLATRTRIPYPALFREWERLRAEEDAKQVADAKAAAEAEVARIEAERKARTFTDARDQLDRLGKTAPIPAQNIGPVDGPFINAELDKVEELDRQHAAARREALRLLNAALGWDLDTTATRPVESMRNEAAASQGAAFLIVKCHAEGGWKGAMRKLQERVLGWLPPTVNRKRSRLGK